MCVYLFIVVMPGDMESEKNRQYETPTLIRSCFGAISPPPNRTTGHGNMLPMAGALSTPVGGSRGAVVNYTPIAFDLDARCFAYWDSRLEKWRADDGAFDLLVGASSADVRSRATWTVAGATPRSAPPPPDETFFMDAYVQVLLLVLVS